MNTVRLPQALIDKVRQVARKQGVTVSDVHRQALDSYCSAELSENLGRSRYDDVIGVIEGPHDLSETTGRRYAEAMAGKYGGHTD